jgi:hypothetical protein
MRLNPVSSVLLKGGLIVASFAVGAFPTEGQTLSLYREFTTQAQSVAVDATGIYIFAYAHASNAWEPGSARPRFCTRTRLELLRPATPLPPEKRWKFTLRGLPDGNGVPPQVSIGGRMAEVLWFRNTPGYSRTESNQCTRAHRIGPVPRSRCD